MKVQHLRTKGFKFIDTLKLRKSCAAVRTTAGGRVGRSERMLYCCSYVVSSMVVIIFPDVSSLLQAPMMSHISAEAPRRLLVAILYTADDVYGGHTPAVR